MRLTQYLKERTHIDVNDFFNKLDKATEGMTKKVLGKINSYPILYFPASNPQKLIIGGFHGEEAAGPLAILNWLENNDAPDDVSFLPLVNPLGFEKERRTGKNKMTPNRGYTANSKEGASEEDNILKPYFNKFIDHKEIYTLHSDSELDKFHLYGKPNDKTEKILKLAEPIFGLMPSKKLNKERYDAKKTANGHIQDYKDDGTFEYVMGIDKALCLETPGKADLQKQINFYTDLIDKIIHNEI